MLNRLYLFLTGYYFLTIYPESKTVAINILKDLGITCFFSQKSNNGSICFKVNAYDLKKIKTQFELRSVSYSTEGILGLPSIMLLTMRRPGILLGIISAIYLLNLSSGVIWHINVMGNYNISDSEIVDMLSTLGCGYGDKINNIDFDLLHSEFLVKYPEISYISVNMNGNHADVEIREKRIGKPTRSPDGLYANIIAKEDGQIIHSEAINGRCIVKNGQIVKSGELLITGVVPIRENEFKLEYAKGEVSAYVTRSCEAEIQLISNKKIYTGKEKTKKTVKIFKKIINISRKGGIEYTTYDKIVVKEKVSLFGVIPLPIWTESCTYKEYFYEESILSSEEAVSIAKSELRESMDKSLMDARLVSSKITTEINDDSITMKCEMKCIADIGKIIEFTAE